MSTPRVAVLTVIYGDRWKFLSQVIEAVMKDSYVTAFVILDNGSKNKKEIESTAQIYGDRIVVLRFEENLGSAGGFAAGIKYVQELDCDYLLMLDDDNVPEEGAIEKFMEMRKKIGDEKMVVVGNRINIPGNEHVFSSLNKGATEPKGTFFETISLEKIFNFFRLATGKIKNTQSKEGKSLDFVSNESFVYGGAFIPIDAVRRAPLPDAELFLYGDDIEYSWGIKRLGYNSYVCSSPKIYDIEMSFGNESQTVGLFNPTTASFRVYYRIRNMVRISIRNTKQFQTVLFVNILIWISALSILGLIKYGISKTYFKRLILIVRAMYGGYVTSAAIPKEVAFFK